MYRFLAVSHNGTPNTLLNRRLSFVFPCVIFVLFSFTDINECQLANSCGANTNCVNAPRGSHTCSCKDGYNGDPRVNCVGKTRIERVLVLLLTSYIPNESR